MQQTIIKTLNYQPQEYLEIILSEPIDNKQHLFYLTHPYLLNCFVHLADATSLYYDTQSFITLDYFLKHHVISKKEIKDWCLSFLELLETHQDGYCLFEPKNIFIDEQTRQLKFCLIPMQKGQDIEQAIVEFVLALYQDMNYEDDDEWISQLYLLVKQRPFRLGLFKQFLTSKKTNRWLSFFRKEDEELTTFFKMIQIQESQPTYGLQTVPFETQVLMAGYQYGYFIDPYQHKLLITSSKWLIGRQKDCDYVLDFPEVSKQHCETIVENGVCYVVDLGSTNGTTLNKERLIPNERYPLHDMDQLVLAGHQLTYYV